MSAPTNINDFIIDIVNNLVLKGRKFPLYIPSMGGRGGSGCFILSLNKEDEYVEVLYLNPKETSTSFMITANDYLLFANHFNSLIKINEQYVVGNYNMPQWKNTPFGLLNNPLVPAIFKQLAY